MMTGWTTQGSAGELLETEVNDLGKTESSAGSVQGVKGGLPNGQAGAQVDRHLTYDATANHCYAKTLNDRGQ